VGETPIAMVLLLFARFARRIRLHVDRPLKVRLEGKGGLASRICSAEPELPRRRCPNDRGVSVARGDATWMLGIGWCVVGSSAVAVIFSVPSGSPRAVDITVDWLTA